MGNFLKKNRDPHKTASAYPSLSAAQGFTLFENMLKLTVLINLFGIAAHYSKQSSDKASATAAALQIKQISQQANQYIQEHFKEFTNLPENSSIPLETIIINSDIDSKKLSNGQLKSYQINKIKYQDQWQLCIIAPIEKNIVQSAWKRLDYPLGAQTGYTVLVNGEQRVRGWGNLYNLRWPDGIGAFPGPGRLILLQPINKSSIRTASILYRKKISHAPWLNQMNTALSLEKNLHFAAGEQQATLNPQQWQWSNKTQADTPFGITIKPSAIELMAGENSSTITPQALSFNTESLEDPAGSASNDSRKPKRTTFLKKLTNIDKNMSARIMNVPEPGKKYSDNDIKPPYLPQSYSQNHLLWSKFPQYLLEKYQKNRKTDPQKQAELVCHMDLTDNNLLGSLGRFFIITTRPVNSTYNNNVYICGKSKSENPREFYAYRLADFKEQIETTYPDIGLPVVNSSSERSIEILRKITSYALFLIHLRKIQEIQETDKPELRRDIDYFLKENKLAPEKKKKLYEFITGKIIHLARDGKCFATHLPENEIDDLLETFRIFSEKVPKEAWSETDSHKTTLESDLKLLYDKQKEEAVKEYLMTGKITGGISRLIDLLDKLKDAEDAENRGKNFLKILNVVCGQLAIKYPEYFEYIGGVKFPRKINKIEDAEQMGVALLSKSVLV